MTLKKMVNTYINFNCDEEVWNTFNSMYRIGLISCEIWNKFYEKCKGYYYNKEDDTVRDENDNILA